jgi:hypothetical protein
LDFVYNVWVGVRLNEWGFRYYKKKKKREEVFKPLPFACAYILVAHSGPTPRRIDSGLVSLRLHL